MPDIEMLTDDDLRELLADGMMGLDLSPGNNLYKRAHDEIIDLRADLKALAVAAKPYSDDSWDIRAALARSGVKEILDA